MKKLTSRKMQRRPRPNRRSKSPLRWLGWLAAFVILCALVLMMLAPSLVTGYIRTYLRKETFSQKAEEMISAKLGGKAHITPLTWNDDTATSTEVSLATASGWSADAGGLHLALDFGAIREGIWRIQNAGADDLTLRHAATGPNDHANASDSTALDDGGSVPSFLRRYIPTKTEISGFEVHRFFFEHGSADQAWKIADAELNLGDWSSGGKSTPAKLIGGTLQTPVRAPEQREPFKFDLTQATLRISQDQLQISDATLRWKQNSEATLRGHFKVESGAWQTFMHAKAVPLDEFLDTTWKQRLTGKVEGDMEFSGNRNAPLVWKADATLKNGALMAIPLLDNLAIYTKSERFKRIVLDICQASFRPEGDALRIDKIIVQSNGLLRIEGSMTLRGRSVNGDFMLGVIPEALSSIPGASNLVFNQTNPTGPPGLLWTHVLIAGTLDEPQEDLSSRLIGGAGMSMLLDTPGKVVNQGAEALLKPILGEDAAKVPGKLMEGTNGLLQNGIKTGTGILNQVLPVFPAK